MVELTILSSLSNNDFLEAGAGGTTLDVMENPMLQDLTTDAGFALALNEVRRLKKGSCLIVAICCESFSAM